MNTFECKYSVNVHNGFATIVNKHTLVVEGNDYKEAIRMARADIEYTYENLGWIIYEIFVYSINKIQ